MRMTPVLPGLKLQECVYKSALQSQLLPLPEHYVAQLRDCVSGIILWLTRLPFQVILFHDSAVGLCAGPEKPGHRPYVACASRECLRCAQSVSGLVCKLLWSVDNFVNVHSC